MIRLLSSFSNVCPRCIFCSFSDSRVQFADATKWLSECEAILRAHRVPGSLYLQLRTALLQVAPPIATPETLRLLVRAAQFDSVVSRVTAHLTEGVVDSSTLQPAEWAALSRGIVNVPSALSVAPLMPLFFSQSKDIIGVGSLFFASSYSEDSILPVETPLMQRVAKDCPDAVHRILKQVADWYFIVMHPGTYSEAIHFVRIMLRAYADVPHFDQVREYWRRLKRVHAGKKKFWVDLNAAFPNFP